MTAMIQATFCKATGEVLENFILSSPAFEFGGGPQGEIRLARNVRDMMESFYAVKEGHDGAGKVKVTFSTEPGEVLERFTFSGQERDADEEAEFLAGWARTTIEGLYTICD